MVSKLIAKIARLYTLIAFGALGLMLASDKIISHEPTANEQLLALFFPFGVLAGLLISWIYMRLGGWITIISVAGFYLMSYGQSRTWSSNELPLLVAGAAPLFLLASFIKTIGHSKRKKKKSR
ncbi:MAG: hypothetical protein GY927_08080 [bacterium]|nr:hypothetical protein [bacterium]